MSKSPKQMIVPILFFVEGGFWAAIIATGGGSLLFWAALSSVVSGVALFAAPSNWVSRPLAGASALFGLTLTIYQLGVGAQVLASSEAMIGAYSAGTFAVFTVIYLYLLYASYTFSATTEKAVAATKRQ